MQHLIQRFFPGSFKNSFILLQLIKRDFKSRYAGSTLGMVWAFLQPLSMMGILWFVFQFGLKAQAVDQKIPFAAWFFTGMIAWNFFADVMNANCHVLGEYSFMLKKVEFDVSSLPLVKILSALIIHGIFLGILICVLLISGIKPSGHWLTVFYYLGCLLYLQLGLSWLISSVNVFLRDLGQVVSIALQLGFWVTPVIWDVGHMPAKYVLFLKLNPVMYITEGYRNAFLYERSFAEINSLWSLYFWGISTVIFILGSHIFKKMKPHFADVI